MPLAPGLHTPEPTSHRWGGARLALARTLAWALLLGGWLVLGTLGRQYLPLWAGGQAAVAAWLVTVGLAQAGLQAADRSRGGPLSTAKLRAALCTCGGLACAALVALPGSAASAGPWLLLAACAWGGLLICASCCVRALRRAAPRGAPSPMSAAVAGALLAWALAGDPAASREATGTVALGLLAAAGALVALMPRGVGALSTCRAGLFDCALHLPPPAAWRDRRQWPRHAAACAMLPMMASLPLMAEWCGTDPWVRGTPPTLVALHLAAMLLPAWALGWAAQRKAPEPARAAPWRPGLQRGGIALAMLLGGLSLVAWPGLSGLMAASLWHAVGWSLAWGIAMSRGPATAPAAVAPIAAGAGTGGRAGARVAEAVLAAMFTGAAVVGLGLATHAWGPQALVAVHGALALVAAAGWAPLQRAGRAVPAVP